MSAIVLDEFTDPNGTRLNAHTIGPTNSPVTSWTEEGSSQWEIQTNQATITLLGAGATYIADCDPGVADNIYQVDVTTGNDANTLAGLMVNGSDLASRNYWILAIRGDTQEVILYEVTGGVFNTMDTVGLTVMSGTKYGLAVVTNGDTITGYVDETPYVSFTGSPRDYKTATPAGLYNSYINGVSFENFRVGARIKILTRQNVSSELCGWNRVY